MAQRITIKILNKPFSLVARSPEDERKIRNAAEKVNAKYYEYQQNFPGKSTDELLSFVALNAFIEIMDLETAAAEKQKNEKELHSLLSSYLDNIDKI